MRSTTHFVILTVCFLILAPPARPTEIKVGLQHLTYSGTLSPENEGRRDFLKWNCYGCHGMNAAGGWAPNIQGKGISYVRQAMTSGGPAGMPSFLSYFKEADLRNIAAYLFSIGTPAEPKWVDWWVPVPTK